MRGENPRVEPPALDSYSDVPLYNTRAVVHQTGVPAPTLRAWERRYGILTPQRGGHDYRLYSERDIVTVVWLRERVQRGMTISQAIALLKNLQAIKKPPRSPTQAPVTSSEPIAAAANGHSGGHAASVPVTSPAKYSLSELQGALLRQLAAFDEVAARHTIAQAMAVHTVEDVCVDLLSPVLRQIGQRWAEGELNAVTEHFASNVVRSQLESIFRSIGQSGAGPLVLVGCAPGELHEIGALMLALFLRRAGMRAAYLGQTVEAASLLQTIRTVHPAVVVLAAVMPDSAWSLAEVGSLIASAPEPDLVFAFGGPAFASVPESVAAIPGVYLDANLVQATSAIRARLGV